jgi:hypothetical protein
METSCVNQSAIALFLHRQLVLQMESVDETDPLLKHEPHHLYTFIRHPGEFFTLEVIS